MKNSRISNAMEYMTSDIREAYYTLTVHRGNAFSEYEVALELQDLVEQEQESLCNSMGDILDNMETLTDAAEIRAADDCINELNEYDAALRTIWDYVTRIIDSYELGMDEEDWDDEEEDWA